MIKIYSNQCNAVLILSRGGGGQKVLAPISTENFPYIRGIATKFVDFPPNLMENMILEKNCIKGITCYHGNTVLMPCLIF